MPLVAMARWGQGKRRASAADPIRRADTHGPMGKNFPQLMIAVARLRVSSRSIGSEVARRWWIVDVPRRLCARAARPAVARLAPALAAWVTLLSQAVSTKRSGRAPAVDRS